MFDFFDSELIQSMERSEREEIEREQIQQEQIAGEIKELEDQILRLEKFKIKAEQYLSDINNIYLSFLHYGPYGEVPWKSSKEDWLETTIKFDICNEFKVELYQVDYMIERVNGEIFLRKQKILNKQGLFNFL